MATSNRTDEPDSEFTGRVEYIIDGNGFVALTNANVDRWRIGTQRNGIATGLWIELTRAEAETLAIVLGKLED